MLRDERYTEIYSCQRPGDQRNGSYGSGFLLGRGLILTARHVIAPPSWGTAPALLDITARPLGPAGRQNAEWLAADLVWPDLAALMNRKPDVALLQLRDHIPGADSGTPLLGLQDNEERDESFAMNVFAVGFPRFKIVSSGKEGRRESHQISGVVKPGSGLVSQSYEIENLQFGIKRDQTPADPASDWVGFSGAPLLANRRVIGVVVTAVEDGRSDFRAERLAPLLKDAEFEDRLRGAATNTTETAKVEAPAIEGLACLMDRDEQEDDFVDLHKRSCGPLSASAVSTTAQPIICMLPGAAEYRHEPEDLANRFALKTLPELAWPAGTTKFEWIDWPAAHLDPQIATRRLCSSLWNRLCGGGDPPDDVAKFRDLWKDGSRSRLFKSDLTDRALTPETAQILTTWYDFLRQVSPSDRRPIGHLMLVGTTLLQVREWLRQAAVPQNVVISELAELRRCTPIHLRTWLNERLPRRLEATQSRILERLQAKLPADFEEPFYLSQLKTRVRELVREGTGA